MLVNDATVIVVDDDPAVRRSVSRLARSAGYNVRAFASPVDFLGEPLPPGPACVLLDMCMEGLSGLDVQEQLRKNDRRVPILFLSGQGTVPTATAGMKHGAEDFLEKPFKPTELIAAIGRAVEQDRSRAADRGERGEWKRRYETLTPREQDVMKLVVTGLLNKQAAAELGISEKTIKVHRARVMEKMGIKSLAALVHIADRIGIERTVV